MTSVPLCLDLTDKSSSIYVIDLEDMELVLSECLVILAERPGGADTTAINDHLDTIERAIATINLEVDKHCSTCGADWEPRHAHVDTHVWA
jgi:hypothetical protein